MATITYGMLFDFLTDERNNAPFFFRQTELANVLGVDPSVISRTLKGERQFQGRIRENGRKEEQAVNAAYVTAHLSSCEKWKGTRLRTWTKLLRDFLVQKDAMTPAIDETYEEEGSKKSAAQGRAFLTAVFRAADDARAKGIPYVPQDKNPDVPVPEDAAVVAFQPFDDAVAERVFIGREDLMQKIEECLKAYGIAIIYGMGGFGKSQAALHYAAIRTKDGTYRQAQQVIFTEKKATINSIRFQGLPPEPEKEEDRMEQRMKELARFHADSLLIIDNMDIDIRKHPDIDAFLERLRKMELHIIITTRNEELFHIPGTMIPIEKLAPEEQMELFRMHYEADVLLEDKPALEQIFQRIGHHTMMIELVAKTMRNSGMDFQEMLNTLASSDEEAVTSIPIDKDNNRNYETLYRYVGRLFDISRIGEEERSLLKKLMLSSVGGLRSRLLIEPLGILKNLEVVIRLVAQSWVIHDKKSRASMDRIHLHPVIRTALQQNLHPKLDDYRAYLKRVADSLADGLDPKRRPKGWMSDDEDDLSDILVNAGEWFSGAYGLKTAALLKQQAELLNKCKKYESALRQYERVVDIYEADTSGVFHPELPYAYHRCGDIATRIADKNYSKAIRDYQEAIRQWNVAADRADGTVDYEAQANDFNKLGNVYRKDSQYPEALNHLYRARDLMKEKHIDSPRLEADIFNNIGILYINEDDLVNAEKYYRIACDIREKKIPEDKEQIAYSYHNIGTIYLRQKKFDEAIEWHGKGLSIRKKIKEGDDPVIADSLTMLGNDYAGKGDAGKAIALIEQGMKIRKDVLDPSHPALAWSYQSRGDVEFGQGDMEAAMRDYEQCYAIRKERLGDRHAYTAEILQRIGRVHFAEGSLDEAEEALIKAADIQGEVKKKAQTETLELLQRVREAKKAK